MARREAGPFVVTWTREDGSTAPHTYKTLEEAEVTRARVLRKAEREGRTVTVLIETLREEANRVRRERETSLAAAKRSAPRSPQPSAPSPRGGRQKTTLQQWAAQNPIRALALWVFVVGGGILASVGYSSDEPAPRTPQNREECERAYEDVGDGTVDWRGACILQSP